jgi:putative NIF3 family GTP cyclohydrolase 1 type 2
MGNNILLARTLGLGKLTPWAEIGWSGEYKEPMHTSVFRGKALKKLGTQTDTAFLRSEPFEVRKVAVIAGGAQHYIVQAHRDGFDTFVTGEPSEPSLYLAQDLNMNFFAFGHDKSERAGVQHLARSVSKKFGVPHSFIAVENPV